MRSSPRSSLGSTARRSTGPFARSLPQSIVGPCSREPGPLQLGSMIGVGRYGNDLILSKHQMLCESSLDMREAARAAEEEHVGTQVAASGAAVVTGEAGPARIERSFRSDGESAHARADNWQTSAYDRRALPVAANTVVEEEHQV